MSTIIILTTER